MKEPIEDFQGEILKRHTKLGIMFAIILVAILILLPIVQTNVSIGNRYTFLISHTTGYVSVAFLYFGFGMAFFTSNGWHGCSGFYWNYQNSNCITTKRN